MSNVGRHSMNSNRGSASLTFQPLTVLPVTPQAGYLAAAQALMPGVELLATGSPAEARALTLVSAHVLECLLKAYLTAALGTDTELKKLNVRHNLVALWQEAASRGLSISATAPSWVAIVGALHGSPYHLRYQDRVHGMQLPATQPMVSEISALLAAVRPHVR